MDSPLGEATLSIETAAFARKHAGTETNLKIS